MVDVKYNGLNLTGLAVSSQQRVALDVIANNDAMFQAIWQGCRGSISSIYYTAASAATSVAGDITIAIYDGADDTAIVSPFSIKDATGQGLPLAKTTFDDSMYAVVTSDNVAGLAGKGMAITVRITPRSA